MDFLKKLLEKPEPTKDELFFHLVFSLVGKLVIADGIISTEETSCVERFIHDGIGLSGKKERAALNSFNKATASEEGHEELASQLKELVEGNMLCLEMVLDVLMQVSVADGEYSESEDKLVLSIAAIFGLSGGSLKHMRFRYSSGAKDSGSEVYYALLDCPPTASLAEVESIFNQLKNLYQAETLKSLGLPEEFLVYTERRFERIQQAYHIIKSEKG